MGFKTAAWGPHAWVTLGGLLQAMDQYMKEYPTKSEAVRTQAVQLARSLTFILPCEFCRTSVVGFLNELATSITKEDTRSLSSWFYQVRQRVNWKLFQEDVKEWSNSTPPQQNDALWLKWWGYQPVESEVVYPLPSTLEWWQHAVHFHNYVLCDFPDPTTEVERHASVSGDYWRLLHELLTTVALNVVPQSLPPLPITHDDGRFAWLYGWHKRVVTKLPSLCLLPLKDVPKVYCEFNKGVCNLYRNSCS